MVYCRHSAFRQKIIAVELGMTSLPTADELHQRIAQTIAWCRLHVSEGDPEHCLRTTALCPANGSAAPNHWGSFDYDWGTSDDCQIAVSSVDALAQCRAELLDRAGIDSKTLPSDLAGGRLLIADPEDSDSCALSGPESLGFIDDLDVPAWDTWICYVRERSTPDPEAVQKTQAAYRACWNKGNRAGFADWQPRETVSYLLCWIPPEFVALVEAGIAVNPTECFFWASEYRQRHYNTEFLRRLDAQGLLR